MKTIQEVKEELEKLQYHLRKFEDLEHNFTYTYEDAEDELLASKINGCLSLAEDLEGAIKNLSKEILTEGHLVLNMNGRYEINGVELTSGSPVEYLDERYHRWSEDRIEHFNGAYGLYYKKDNDIGGLYARIRVRQF